MAAVFIVDNDTAFCAALSNELTNHGHSVRTIDDAQSTLNKVLSGPPDAILFDANMPGTSGIAILSQLRSKHPELNHIVFIFLSNQAPSADIIAGLKAGADDFMAKFVGVEILAAKTCALIALKHRMEIKAEQDHIRLYKSLMKDIKDPNGAPGNAPATDKMGRSGPPKHDSLPAFQKQLDDCLKGGKAHAVSKLHFVSLSELREKLGDKWENMAKTALALAETIIKRHVANSDIYIRQSEDGFLLLFPDTASEDATLRAEIIANEIRAKLMGGPDKQISDLELKTATIKTDDIPPTTGHDGAVTISVDAINNMLAKKIKTAPKPLQDPIAQLLSQIKIRYAGIWNPQKSAVPLYRCYPTCKTPYGVHFDSDVLHGGMKDPLLDKLDMHVLTNALLALDKSSEQSGSAGVSIPIHYSTFQKLGAAGFREVFDAVPIAQFKNRLTLELIGLPDAPDEIHAAECVGFMSDYARFISARCRPDDRYAGGLAFLGVKFMGVGLETLIHQDSEQETLSRLYAFSRHIKSLGMQSYVFDLNRSRHVAMTIESNITLLSGSGVTPETTELSPIYPLDAKTVMSE